MLIVDDIMSFFKLMEAKATGGLCRAWWQSQEEQSLIYEPSFLLCSLSVEITLFVYQFSVTSKEAWRLTTFVLYSFKK